jgi:hypothetical protein
MEDRWRAARENLCGQDIGEGEPKRVVAT